MGLAIFLIVALADSDAQAQCAVGQWDNGGSCELCACGSYCPDGINQVACSPGTFNPLTGSSSSVACQDCAAGFVSAGGACSCSECIVGTFQPNQGSSTCLDCNSGTFSAVSGSTACQDCSAGTYQPNQGSSTCLDCNSGTFSAFTGSVFCTSCSTGTYQPNQGSTTCFDCDAGTFSSTSGSTACTNCSPGTFASDTGSVLCSNCAEDTYQPNEGAIACFECACDDSNACTTDSCDMIDGSCTNEPIPDCGPAVSSLPRSGFLLLALGILSAGLFAMRPRSA